MQPNLKPQFFETPADFYKWLAEHHKNATELWVGFYKKDSGKKSITWPESVDQALCHGWIDGIRKSIDAESYMIRFTPRKPSSVWSRVNIGRIEELTNLGMMQEAGLKAFKARKDARSEIYAYEQKVQAQFDAAFSELFHANKQAWDFFTSCPKGYQKTATWWVISAKREETKLKRLNNLITVSENGRTLAHLTRPNNAT